MSIRLSIADMLRKRSYTKGNPTGSTLHVPAPMGADDPPDKKKQRRKDVAKAIRAAGGIGEPQQTFYADQTNWRDEHTALVAKAGEDPGMYVGRMVLNVDELARWWDRTRFYGDEPELDPSPHVTCMYSLATFDWKQDRTVLVVDSLPQPDTFGLLGPKKAVVIHLDSPILESRWAAAVAAGAKSTFSTCKMHCTLFYLGAGYDSITWRDGNTSSLVRPPALVLGPEIIGPRGIDVYPAVGAPDWYKESRGVTT